MIRLQNVLKMSWRRICKTSWRRFEDVLKMSWRGLENVLKTSWRRLEDLWTRRIYWSWQRRLEYVLKTSFEDKDERRLHQDECLLGKICSIIINIKELFHHILSMIFQEKIYCRLYSIIWRNFILWFYLLLKISDNICIAIVYYPVCDIINFEIYLSFLIKS